MKIIFSLMMILFLSINHLFCMVNSVQSGKWSSASTWENGLLPSVNDTVVVLKNHTISISDNNSNCNKLIVKGSITFLSSGKNFKIIQINLEDSGSINASVLGTIECQKINILGDNEISGVNLNCFDSILVKGHLFFKRKSGVKNFNHIQILKNGIWEVSDDASFNISGNFSNSGKFISGNGAYVFNGDNNINGNSSTVFNKLQFSGKLSNSDSLTIVGSVESLGGKDLSNLSGATLISLTTPSNFKSQLNLMAVNNVFVLNRNQNQTIPTALNNQFYHLKIQNEGTCVLNANINLIGDLTIGNKVSLVIKDYALKGSGLGNFTLKDSSSIQFYNNNPDDFATFMTGFLNHQSYISSKISIFTTSFLNLPASIFYPNLELFGFNEKRIVRFIGDKNMVMGDLYLNDLINLDLSDQTFEIKGGWTGSGSFTGFHSNIIYSGNRLQKIFAGNYDTLQYLNGSTDTAQFYGAFSVNSFLISSGILKIGSLNIGKTLIEKDAQVVVGGSTPNFNDSLQIKGKFIIQSDFAFCSFNHIKVFSGGSFLNNGLSNPVLKGNLFNDGIFRGCLGTGCTWELKDKLNFDVVGTQEIYLPRLSMSSNAIIHNKGNLLISNRIFGKGNLINYSSGILSLGMNPELMEVTINCKDYEGNTVVFSNDGDQDIAQYGFTYFHNLHIKGFGIKRLMNTIFLAEDLRIDTLSVLHSGYFSIRGTENGIVTMDPNSNLILGDYLNEFPTPFPLNIKGENCFLDSSSTVTYSSWKNQEILATPHYGNLVLQDGIGESNKKTLGGGSFLIVNGNLDIKESSVLFYVDNKNLSIAGDWNGSGNLFLSTGNINIKGNGNNTGEFTPGISTVSYNGLGKQKIKTGNYFNLTIDKKSGISILEADVDYLKIKNKLWIKEGTFEVKGEKIHAMDSTIIDGELILSSRVQEKRFTNLTISSNGSFNNSYGVDVHIDGDLLNLGSFVNSSRALRFNSNNRRQIIDNKGVFTIAGLIVNKGLESLTIEGEIQIQDSLDFKSGQIKLKNCLLKLSDKAFLKGESETNELSGEKSKISFRHLVLADENTNIKGLGLSIKSDKNIGLVSMERHFSAYDIYYDFPGIKKSFLITPLVDSGFIATLKIKYYKHELNGINENDLVIYKSKNLGESFKIQSSIVDTAKNELALSDITSFSLWTAGDKDLNPLPLDLLSFTGDRIDANVNLKWETTSEWDIEKYQIWYSLDGVNFNLVQNINPLGGFKNTNFYSLSHLNETLNWTYYKLVEVNKDGESTILKQISIPPYQYITSVLKVCGNSVSIYNLPKNTIITVCNIEGKEIEKFQNLDDQNALFTLSKSGIYFIEAIGNGFVFKEKFYVQ